MGHHDKARQAEVPPTPNKPLHTAERKHSTDDWENVDSMNNR